MNQANLLFLSVLGAGLVLIPSRWWLPPSVLVFGLLSLSLTAIIALRGFQFRWVLPVAAMSLGAAVSVWQVNNALSERVSENSFGQDVVLTVKLISIIDERPRRQIVIADTLADESNGQTHRWRIAWYGVPQDTNGELIELEVGDVWQMNLRIRSLQGAGNPGGFDVSGWYLRTHVDGAAYVRQAPAPVRISRGSSTSIDEWRASMAKRILNASSNDEFDHVVVALVLGLRAGIDNNFSQLLVKTGTAHLLAISGLHIGLVSAAGFWLFKYLWGLFPTLVGKRHSRFAFAGFFSLCLAVGYALIAGLSPSTLRAVGMCAVGIIVVWQRRSRSLWLPFAISMALVVFTDVLRLLSPGVWLSFTTVAIIILLHRPNPSRTNLGTSVLAVWRTHAALGLCLLPITGWFFSQGSLIAPLANLVAVPVVSFIVVPLSLLVVLFVNIAPILALSCLSLANATIALLEQWLKLCAAVPYSDIGITVPSVLLLVGALLGTLLLSAPRALGVRRYCLPLCLPVFIWSIGAREVYGLEVHVLDVGQGHASLVFTENHVVLVDTGGTLGGERTHWESTVLPALRRLGRTEITHVVISHSDSDHSAGAEKLASDYPEAEFWLGGVSFVPNLSNPKRCSAGEAWRIDGVEFSFLHPAKQAVEPNWIGQDLSDNDHSCVLLVQFGKSTVLFPGDLEQRGEGLLMQRLRPSEIGTARHEQNSEPAESVALALQDRLTVLVAPHHGSRTSSTPEFVQGWLPEHVVFPSGHQNRLGFPHVDVRMRYKEIGSVPYVTGQDGAVRFQMGPKGLLTEPSRYWDKNNRLWHPSKR